MEAVMERVNGNGQQQHVHGYSRRNDEDPRRSEQLRGILRSRKGKNALKAAILTLDGQPIPVPPPDACNSPLAERERAAERHVGPKIRFAVNVLRWLDTDWRFLSYENVRQMLDTAAVVLPDMKHSHVWVEMVEAGLDKICDFFPREK